MRKVKKVTAPLTAGVTVASMATCGTKRESAAATTAAQSQESKEGITEVAKSGDAAPEETIGKAKAAKDSYILGYIAYNNTDIWNEYSSKASEYAASQTDVEVKTIVLDSKSSLKESIIAMESLIQQEVDGISIPSISTEQGAQLVKMADEANIPVTIESFAMDINDPGDYTVPVACEYDQIGYAAMKYTVETKSGAKVFSCAGQEDVGVYEKYQEGVDRALADLGDQVEVVATFHGNWLTDKAYNVTTDFTSTGQEFDYIFANSGMMTQGCYQVLKDVDMVDIPIVSTGGSSDNYKMLQDGMEAVNMTAPVSIQGTQTFKNLYDAVAEGKTPEKFVSLPIVPVSADKLDGLIVWDDYAAAYDYAYGR